MTDSGPPEEAPHSPVPVATDGTFVPDPADDGVDPAEVAPAAYRPGARTFTLEGRVAPGLFISGWLAFLAGAGCLLVAVLAANGELATLILVLAGLGLVTVGLILGAGSQALERKARAAPYAGPSPFLVYPAIVAGAAFATIVVGRPAVALGLDPNGPAAVLLSLTLQAIVAVGLIRLLVVGPGALPWAEMGLAHRPSVTVAGDIAWGVVLATLAVFATTLLGVLLLLILPAPDAPLVPRTTGPGILANLIAAGAIAPVWEELFFRGFATTAWTRSMPVGRAMIRAALFFAAVHTLGVGGDSFGDALGRAAYAFIVRLPVAFGFELVFVRRRSLVASIAMHASFNTILVLLTIA